MTGEESENVPSAKNTRLHPGGMVVFAQHGYLFPLILGVIIFR